MDGREYRQTPVQEGRASECQRSERVLATCGGIGPCDTPYVPISHSGLDLAAAGAWIAAAAWVLADAGSDVS